MSTEAGPNSMKGRLNWNLPRVKALIKEEKDAETIMAETGIKIEPLRAIVGAMSQQDKQFYRIKGLFKEDKLQR